MTEEGQRADEATEEYGITEHDMEKIVAYLQKSSYRRSADDLQDSTNE